MNDQMAMVLLAELPGWLQAAGWGALSASGLLIGAVGGYHLSLQHTTIARTMTFASGVLLAVVAVDLVINARGAASLHRTVTGLLCGAAVFSSVNWLLLERWRRRFSVDGGCIWLKNLFHAGSKDERGRPAEYSENAFRPASM